MKCVLRLVPWLVIPGCALAQSAEPLGGEDLSSDQVIITATRSEQSVDTTLASISIITREDIDRLQPHSVAELLQGLPGIALSLNGDLGKATALYLRGTDPDHVLVLIDGVEIGSATLGIPAWEQLPVEQIERIEVVRGPDSSLYGSQALGGVVQIFTRQAGPGAPDVPSFSVSGGTHATYQGGAGYSGSAGGSWYNASASGLYTDGIPLCRADAPATASCFTSEPRQGYWSGSIDLGAGYRFENGTELSFTGLRTWGDTKFNGNAFAGNESRIGQQAVGVHAAFAPIGPWQPSLAVGQSLDQSTLKFDDAAAGFFDTRRNTASWLNLFQLAPQQVLQLGADYQEDIIASDAGCGVNGIGLPVEDCSYLVRSRDDAGVFGLYRGSYAGWELQLSKRYDHNQQFGGFKTGNAALAYRFDNGLRLLASYGTAFKAPTFNDLYYPFYGTPTLQPETSDSTELGVEGGTRDVRWSVHGYETHVSNLIEYNPETFAADNIDRARIRGIESQLGARVGAWHAQAYWTWLDPRNRAQYYGALLPRRARESGRLDLDWETERLSVGSTVFVSGPRFEDPANTERLGGYGTVDLRASWTFLPHWMLQALLRNAFDKEYETALYYNQLGRSAYLTLRYSPASL